VDDNREGSSTGEEGVGVSLSTAWSEGTVRFLRKDRGAVLIERAKALQHQPCKDQLDRFYVYLSILDTKATGLLTVNTVVIAILLVFVDKGDTLSQVWHIPHPLFILKLQLLFVSVSAFLCLLVMRVSWEFLARVKPGAAKASDFEDELQRLASVIYDRTRYYWFAWFLALLALILTLAWWHYWWALAAACVVILWCSWRG
jgi:hypothetical protein